jgi:hypothetical protein
MHKGTQIGIALAVMTAVLVLLLHPATPGVTAPVDGKQLKQMQTVLLVLAATLTAFVYTAQVRLQVLDVRSIGSERSPERTLICSLLC